MTDPATRLSGFIRDSLDFGDPISDGVDLFERVRITGDDASDFMDLFFETFDVNASTYRWYFHHAEEGDSGFGGVFFRSPDQKVEHIAITPDLLREAISSKEWPIEYPGHDIPRIRGDVLVNQFLAVGLLIGVVAVVITRFVS